MAAIKKSAQTKTKKVAQRKPSGVRRWLSVGKRSTIVPFVVFALVFSAIGGYYVTQSQAAVSGSISAADCRLLGRAYVDGKCTNKCTSTINGNYLVTNQAYNYCKGNISFIPQTTCNNKNRQWSVFVGGCARRNDQQTTNNAIQCASGYSRYVVASTLDFCDTRVSVSK